MDNRSRWNIIPKGDKDTMKDLKERSKYWEKKRNDYIDKVNTKYKTEISDDDKLKTTRCPICNNDHKIDKYNFVDSCIGYFDMDSFAFEIEKWLEKRLKKDGKSK